MLLYLLFAVTAFADCETGTCLTCKNMTGCDWYNFDCLNTSGTYVKTINPTVISPCPACQAGSCGECQSQNCSWYSSVAPGISGKCEATGYTNALWNIVDTCPVCQTYSSCETCNSAVAQRCGWYVLPGSTAGKCREASPSFAYTKLAADQCAGNLCAGIQSCSKCQNTTRGAGNSTNCVWYKSQNSKFYDSKCDDSDAGVTQTTLFTANVGECPKCAGTSCAECKTEPGCKWAAVTTGGVFGTAFGQCLQESEAVPLGKNVLATCPSDCDTFTCGTCASKPACAWFADSKIAGEDDECDLRDDKHFTQTAITDVANCKACSASRCYECNSMANCGWYVKKILGMTIYEGCYETSAAPSDRELRANSDSACDGVPSSSSQLAASLGVVIMLAIFA